MGAMAFFFPLCLRSARENLSGCLDSSSLSLSFTFISTCRDTRACKALEMTTEKKIITIMPIFCIYKQYCTLDESILVKLQELIVWHSMHPQSILVHQVGFEAVTLILIFLRPSNVEGCLCHPDSLRLQVPVNFQRLGAVFCLMTNMHGKGYCAALVARAIKTVKLKCYTYKFDPKINIARVIVIFLFFCESGHNLFQQLGEVTLLSTLRKGLLCPLDIPAKDRTMWGWLIFIFDFLI